MRDNLGFFGIDCCVCGVRSTWPVKSRASDLPNRPHRAGTCVIIRLSRAPKGAPSDQPGAAIQTSKSTQRGRAVRRPAALRWRAVGAGVALPLLLTSGCSQFTTPAARPAMVAAPPAPMSIDVNPALGTRDVSPDAPITVRGNISRQLSVPIGGGGPTIRATTTNGSVTIARR